MADQNMKFQESLPLFFQFFVGLDQKCDESVFTEYLCLSDDKTTSFLYDLALSDQKISFARLHEVDLQFYSHTVHSRMIQQGYSRQSTRYISQIRNDPTMKVPVMLDCQRVFRQMYFHLSRLDALDSCPHFYCQSLLGKGVYYELSSDCGKRSLH